MQIPVAVSCGEAHAIRDGIGPSRSSWKLAILLSAHKVHLYPLLDEPCRASFNRRMQQQRKASCFNADPTHDPIDPPVSIWKCR